VENIAKINQLNFFNLFVHKPRVIWTENPRVGGSIPPLGTNFHLIKASEKSCQQKMACFLIIFSFSTVDQKSISE